MGNPFDGFTAYTPQTQETSGEAQAGNAEAGQSAETIPSGVQSPVVETPTEKGEVKDTFIDDFNKRFNTQYKGEEEIKTLFDLPKKISEYDSKYKDYDTLKQSNDQYKKDLDDLRQEEAQKYLGSPLMQKAYIADQLVKKYPKADIGTLTELAMSDLGGMSDIDVLTKEQKMKLPNMNLQAIKTAILSEVGLDSDSDPQEWDEVAKVKLAMRAANARENLSNMVSGIEMPKVETKEQREQRLKAEQDKRTDTLKPYLEEFRKFDTYSLGENLPYTVPDDFKSRLGDMANAFFTAGNELTAENMDLLKEMRESQFLYENRDKIFEVIRKDERSKFQKELDEKLGNSKAPNTATAGENVSQRDNQNNAENYVRDISGRRVTKW